MSMREPFGTYPTGSALVVDRRHFLRNSLMATVSTAWLGSADADEHPTAERLVTGKDPRLIVHSVRPVELETPLELLRTEAVTPKSMLFVRNNGMLEKSLNLKPLEAKEWSIDFSGLVEHPRSIDIARLAELEQVETELVLQCSGNGRAFFTRAAKTSGSQWQHGALGNVRFAGVPLQAVVKALKLNIGPEAKFLTARGRDSALSAEQADFEHSIPLADALSKSLIALRLNGEPLPAVHGGPIRLVTPGYYGTMNVKWLSRLRLEATETFNHHQVRRYRTPRVLLAPGTRFTPGLDNSDPNWGMRIKSLFFAPLDGQRVRAGSVEARGVAWNDGSCKIEAVELSRDGGLSWQQARLEAPASPYAWYHWKAVMELRQGDHSLSCRAVDVLGRSQPLRGAVTWNPAGYAWNGVHTIKVTAS